MGVYPSQIVHVPNHGVELLGSPIGSREFVTDFLERRIQKVAEVHSILEEMDDAQIELALLRGCLGFGKVVHLLRTCPPSDILQALHRFDLRLRARVAGILRTPFLEADVWKQASLPIRLGGLGITRTLPLASPAYLGSCALTHGLVSSILRRNPNFYVPPHVSCIASAESLFRGADIHFEGLRNVSKVQKRIMGGRHEVEFASLLAIGSLCH